MKSLTIIVAFASTFGVLALYGCDGCSQQDEAKKTTPPVTCGPGTVVQGDKCVGTVHQR